MAEVFRGPIVARIPTKPSAHALQSQAGVQTNLLLTTLRSQDALPFVQTTWALPAASAPSRDLRTHVDGTEFWLLQDLFFGVAGQPPQAPMAPPPMGAARRLVDGSQAMPMALMPTTPAASPFIPIDFPLPRQKPRTMQPISYRPTSAAPTAWVPFPFGAIFDLPPQPAAYARALRTYLKPYDAYVIPSQAVAAPFIQTEWPLPLAKPFPIDLRTFVDGFEQKYIGQDALPGRQSEWPLPLAKPYPIDLRTYVDPLALTLVNQDRMFGGAGQPVQAPMGPVPQGKPFPVELRFSGFSPLVPTLAGGSGVPVRAYDFPNPTGKPYPVALRTHVGFYVIDDSAPFAQKDWSLPLARPALRELRTFTDSLRRLLTSVDALPYAQTDWPLPRAKAYPPDLRTFSRAPNFQLVGQDALPCRQGDWPLPRGRAFPLELRTWLQTTDVAFTEAIPLSQRDWPNPTGKPFPPALRTWLQARSLLLKDVMFGAAGQPLSNYDWPLPQGKPFPRELRTWVRSLAGPTFVPIFLAFWALHANKHVGKPAEGSPE